MEAALLHSASRILKQKLLFRLYPYLDLQQILNDLSPFLERKVHLPLIIFLLLQNHRRMNQRQRRSVFCHSGHGDLQKPPVHGAELN